MGSVVCWASENQWPEDLDFVLRSTLCNVTLDEPFRWPKPQLSHLRRGITVHVLCLSRKSFFLQGSNERVWTRALQSCLSPESSVDLFKATHALPDCVPDPLTQSLEGKAHVATGVPLFKAPEVIPLKTVKLPRKCLANWEALF